MKNLSAKKQKELLEIAKKAIYAEERGSLEAKGNDSEDFIETSVWSLAEALKEAYLFGKASK
jgi:hypothetical protein